MSHDRAELSVSMTGLLCLSHDRPAVCHMTGLLCMSHDRPAVSVT